MKQGQLLLITSLALLAETILPTLSPALPALAPLVLHGILALVGALLLVRASAGSRVLPSCLVLTGAALSLVAAGRILGAPRADRGPDAQRSSLERDAGVARAAFASLLESERDLLRGLPQAVLREGTSREEIFSRLSEYIDSRFKVRTGAGAITLYRADGQPVAWAGEASVLDPPDLQAYEGATSGRFVRSEILGTRLYTVRVCPGPRVRYAVSEILLDAPSDPGAWERLLKRPSELRSTVSAEFLDSSQADSSLKEFLQAGGDQYWTKGRGAGIELMIALRGDGAELLGILTLRPAPDPPSPATRGGNDSLPASALLVAVLMICLAIALPRARAGRAGGADLAALAVLILALRALGSTIAPMFAGGSFFDYRLFSLPSFAPLARSPGETLFTALAVLGLAGLIVAAPPRGGGWTRAAALLPAGAIAAALVWQTPAWISNSQLNLARSPFLAPQAARLALYSAHSALALAAALLFVRALARTRRPLPLKWIAGAWLAATVLSYLLLARAVLKVPAALVETGLAPEVIQARADARTGLLAMLSHVEPDSQGEILDSDNVDALNRFLFETWRNSDLGQNGMRSAVAILGPDGNARASFAYGLPESVFRDLAPPRAAPAPSAEGAARSGSEAIPPILPTETAAAPSPRGPVLTQVHYTVLSLDVPLLRGEIDLSHDGRIVGRFAALVSVEQDNIPFLTLSDPLLRSFGLGRADPVFDEYFGGAPLFLAWSPAGEVLYPSAERAAPLAARDLPVRAPTWTRMRFEGDPYRIYLFPTPEGPRAIGYSASGRTFLPAGLVRALLAGVPLLLLVLACPLLLRSPGSAAVVSPGRWVSFITGSYYRRLLAVVLISSLVPLLLLAGIFRGSIERRTREEFERDGVQAAGTIRRLLEDYVESSTRAQSTPNPIESWTLFWLGRTVHEDIDLFAGAQLAATSRGNRESSGLLTFRLSAEVARALALKRPPQFLSRELRPGRAETIVYAPVRLKAGVPEGIIAVPLILEERGLGRAGEAIGDAILTATFGLGLALLGVGYLFARRLSVPIRELGSASRRIAAGNLDVRVRPRGHDEIRQLVDAFNGMAVALSEQREDLRRRRDYIEAILLNVTTGVISTDAGGTVRTANPAASILLGLPAELAGKNLFAELASRPELAPVLALWLEGPAGTAPTPPREISLHREGAEIRLRSVVLPLAESQDAPPGRIYLVEDVTEVMRSNRLEAWAEMARRIAHEIKNPLTPIQLSAEHLLRVRDDAGADYDRVLRECVETILCQVRALREISSDFSAYSRLPDLHREPTDLAPLLRSTLAPYRTAPPPGIRIEESYEPLAAVPVDARVLRRAIVNLVENALQAMDEGGTLRVSLRRANEGDMAQIEVADTGQGIDEATLGRVFEPYFSTRDSGVGLGLAIARRAVEEHGGTISAHSTPGLGTRMIMRIPIASPQR